MSPRKSQRLASATTVVTLQVTSEEALQTRPRQPSSADSLHAPRPPAVHTLKIAQADGFGAPLPAPKAADPAPQTPTPVQAKDLQPSKDKASATPKKQKSSWNALRRYYSEASSFPDYGPPQPDMGSERLRQMNQSWASVNTLAKSSNKRQLHESSPPSHQSLSKRQRRDNHLKNSISPESAHQRSPPKSRSPLNNGSRISPAASARTPIATADAYEFGSELSRVTSDITPRKRGPKRQSAHPYSSTLSKQSASRSRALLEHDEIETSEDELQSNHSTFSSNTRQTNFSQIKQSPRKRPQMRGDITPTKFRDSAPREAAKLPPMTLSRAVSGRETYESADSNHSPLYLRQPTGDATLLEAFSNGKPDEAHQWISFDVKSVNNVRYGGCYLSFRRSMSRGRPPTVSLQFASPQGAAQVATMIKSGMAESHTREEMLQIMDYAWRNALHRQSSYDAALAREHATSKEADSHGNAAQRHRRSPEGNTRKLKDRMTVGSNQPPDQRRSASPVRRMGMETRRTRRQSPTRKESIPVFARWSEKNTSWEDNWKQTLVYPATGRNRASVDKEDIIRLDEGEFLNDNLISFYLRYLQTNMERERPELFTRVHIFSTFFFEKLTSRKGGINYDGVKSWTSKLDLFSFDYIVVPVNENAHWYLAVICNTPKLLETADDTRPVSTDALGRPRPQTPVMTTVEREMSDISLEDVTATRRSTRQLSSGVASSPAKTALAESSPAPPATGPRPPSRRLDASQPRIVTLDSLGSNHSATCKALKEYLVEEAKDKKNFDLVTVPGGMKARGIPEQNNFCDCGIFVLGYMEEFLKDPDGLVRKILMREDVDWSINAVKLRKKVRNILFRLQKEQTERLAKEREEKRHQKRLSKSSISSASEIIKDASPRSVGSNKRDQSLTPRLPQKSAFVSPPAARRSITPPAVINDDASRAVAENSADEGTVDIVRMPVEAMPAQESSQQQSPERAAMPRREKSLPNSPLPSSTLDEAPVNDTQDSVQLVSVVEKSSATPQQAQTKAT